jgi:hypothetical protein
MPNKKAPREDVMRSVVFYELNKLAKPSTWITADDVHWILDRYNYPKSPAKRLSIIRSMLNTKNFIPTGLWLISERKEAKCREVQAWVSKVHQKSGDSALLAVAQAQRAKFPNL